MNLEEKIIEVLTEGKPLKAKEIVLLLASKYEVQVDTTAVNSILYRKLRDKAEQNKNYQWSLRKKSNGSTERLTSSANSETPLSKLSYYYLECISKDMDAGISVFASSQFSLEYLQINSFPSEQGPTQRIQNHLLNKVKQDKNSFVFKLGYPMLIRSFTAKNGNSYLMAEPLTNENLVSDHGPRYPKLNTRVMISDWEKYLYEALYRAGIPTIPQYQVGQYSLDLAIIDGDRKLNIEVDGEKYHRNWDGELMRRDQLRNKRLIELGWDVQRFWVYQVRDNMKQCIEKIREWKR